MTARPDTTEDVASLVDALADFHRSPGRFNPAAREPAVLFRSMTWVLQAAAGRARRSGGLDERAMVHAQAFVRSALLRSHASHYDLLGVDPTATEADLKAHYRLLMRLIHPDFAQPGVRWPADAASRINLAHDVLSSPDRRRAYDEELARMKQPPRLPKSTAASRRRDPGLVLKVLSVCFGVAGASAALALIYVAGDEESFLVQRAAQRPPQPLFATRAPEETAAETTTLRIALVTADERPMRGESSDPASGVPSASHVVMAQATHADGPVSKPPLAFPPEAAAQPEALPREASPAQGGVSLAQAHPLLTRLLVQAESGVGERLLRGLDGDARDTPGARSLVRRYSSLVGTAQDVKVRHAEFDSEPLAGGLRVNGTVTLEVLDPAIPFPQEKQLLLQAEFAMRPEGIVMTGLRSWRE